jgi:hypothetical protein
MDSTAISKFENGLRPFDPPKTRSQGGKRSRICSLCAVMMLTLCANLPAQRPQFPPPLPTQRPQVSPPTVQQQNKGFMKMRVEEGKVTADITDTPLQVVLQELAEWTGVIFEVRSQENSPVSIHLQHVSLQEAIQRITPGSNTIYLYGQGEESAKLKLARIFPRTPPVQQPALVYLGTGAVTKNNHTVETQEQALQALASSAILEDREMAIEVLVKNKGEVAVRALTDSIADPAPEIRVAAIEGLAAMGARAALPEILKSLKDSHPGVRQSAVTAVALLGDAGNLKDLKPLTSDKDTSVATAAEVAIGKLSSSGKK